MYKRREAWAACLAILVCCHSSQAAQQSIRTESGLVEGIESDDATIYRGIPFAAAPTGDLRWREPQPARPWSGVRKADRFAPVCPQKGVYPPDSPAEEYSEDCLYLNIWAPLDAKGRNLAVMVWIHGGGLRNGSGSLPLYAGDRLVQRDVIVVTMNYRLGVFGFLAHPELTRESGRGASGNYGLLDQLAALGWVKRNIAEFGGDPDRITVFGQSSGAMSISALIATPLAQGLFQRAIGQSGGLLEPMDLLPDFTLPGAEEAGGGFAARAGATNLASLRGRSTEELLAVPFSPHIIIDGFVLKRPPYDVFSDGEQNKVDVLLGLNRDEGTFFLAGRTITAANLQDELSRNFPSFLIRLAGPDTPLTDAEARTAASDFNRDLRFGWSLWTWAKQASREPETKVFAYRFSRAARAGTVYAGMGATHGSEMPYVFDHLGPESIPWTPEDRRLASAMAEYWTRFAKDGDPNGGGLPSWPAFTLSTRQGMHLGDEIEAGAPFEERGLERIDRVYSGARFVLYYSYPIAGATIVVVLGGPIWWICRRRRSASAKQ